MKKLAATARAQGPSFLDTVFAGGCTAAFLTLVVTLAGAVSLYLR